MMKRFLVPLIVLVGALFLGACGASDSASESGPSEEGSANVGERGSSEDSSETSGGAEGIGEEISASGGTFTRVSPEEMKEAVEAGDVVLVNTHVPFAGDIPGTDLSIPFNEIAENTDRLPGKDAGIALYCLGGPMSDEASRTLVELGYTNVWDLGGGMEAWRDAGLPLEGA